jgi:hypothetical protein
VLKPVEIIRQMQAQYGDNCLSRSKIYEWIDHFKKGKTSVCDEERSERPSTSRIENSIQAVERTIRENRRITVDDMAEGLNIRHGSAYSTLHDTLNCSSEKLVKDTTKNFFSDGTKKNV